MNTSGIGVVKMIPIHVLNSIVNVLTIRGNQGCFNIGISCDEIVENTINEFYPLIKGSWSVMDIRDKRGRPINIFGRIYDYHWVLCLNVLSFGTVVLDPMHNNYKMHIGEYQHSVQLTNNGGINFHIIDENSRYFINNYPNRVFFNCGDLLRFKPWLTK